MKRKIKRLQVSVNQCDLSQLTVDAIVNDTDTLLSLPDEWIAIAGDELAGHVNLVGWCDVGSAVATTAGKLPSQWVIHAVGPRWGDANARGILAKVVWEVLQLAVEKGITSLALPPISTGTQGYPVESCAKVMIEQVIDFAYEPQTVLRQVNFCTTNTNEQEIFTQELLQQIEEANDAGASPAWLR